MSIVDKVRIAAEPVVQSFGLELWDVEYKKEGSEYFLRIIIDRPDGVWVSDCEEVSRKLDPIIDELDLIDHSFNFEVLSAGLVRELNKTDHINRFAGKTVSVCLYKLQENLPVKTKKFDATIVSANEDSVIFEINGENFTLDRKIISKIKIDLV